MNKTIWLSFALLFGALAWKSFAASTNSTYVICEGDSLTEGNGASPRTDSNYVAQTFNIINPLYGTWFTNLGHSGDKLEDLSRDPTNMLQALTVRSNINTYAKVTLVLQGGGNDIYTPSSVASITNWMHKIITNWKARFPNDYIVLGTSTEVTGADPTITNKFYELAQLIRANHYGVDAFVDWAGDPRLADSTSDTYFDPDDVHPNNAGCAVMSELLRPVLINNRRVQDDFFVRKDGSDSNTGTTNNATGAFLTIQKAADSVNRGDWIHVNDGYYAEQVTVRSNSAASDPIRIFGGASVSNGGWVLTSAASNVVVQDFALTGTNVGADRVMQTLGSFQTLSNLAFYGITNIGNYPSGAIMGSGSISNRWERLFVKDSGEHYYVVLGQGHTITNIAATGETGWDMIRVFCRDTLFTSIVGTNLTNPHANPSAHPDFVQAFGDNGDLSVDNVFDGVYLNTLGDDYQLGNITDDQETNGIARWTFKNMLCIEIARTMNLYAPDFSFYHCTWINCATNSSDVITHGSSGAGHADGLTIMNSVFYHCGERISGQLGDTASRGWYDGDAITGGTRDYNLVIGQGAGTTKTGFSEVHGINGSDPLFNASWKPTDGSPLLNAGTNLLSLVSTDILGNARDSTPTIGAYEDAGEAPDPPVTGTRGIPINIRARR